MRIRTSVRRAPINLGCPRRFYVRLAIVERCQQLSGELGAIRYSQCGQRLFEKFLSVGRHGMIVGAPVTIFKRSSG